ncbi:MAG: HAD family hydrolase [Thiomargarita sp.]|nr:HAD family hydrolase [Thiomargarita sp.]
METLKRSVFTLKSLFHYRNCLVKIVDTTSKQQTAVQISPTVIKQQGINILILDFDGVLSAHGELFPTSEIQAWLQLCVNILGANNIFILSNKPLPARVNYFKQHYSGIRFITNVKKKPYPDGLEKVIQLTKQSPQNMMLVDDRLLTGCLAACIVDMPVTYITKPYRCFSKRLIKESFFASLRFSEYYLAKVLL